MAPKRELLSSESDGADNRAPLFPPLFGEPPPPGAWDSIHPYCVNFKKSQDKPGDLAHCHGDGDLPSDDALCSKDYGEKMGMVLPFGELMV